MNLKVCGYELDDQQQAIVEDDSQYLLVTAGAGSGKTLTILAKIYYLITKKGISPNEIICISFTNAASESLKQKIKKEFNYDIQIYTFHKLALKILKNKYKIADPDLLNHITHIFLNQDIYESNKHLKMISKYLKIKPEKYLDYNKEYLEREIITFIKLFKSNNYQLSDFNRFLKKSKLNIFSYRKEKIFLVFVLNIYLRYQNELKQNNEIDFDDMIIKASKKEYKEDIKYIIIDEYQDTSYVRLCLIKSIINQTGAKLLVVGDDFQSIYRFTGCDLNIFLNFKKYFKPSKIMKIENTYRNSQELINVAGKFIMKNKKQIKKNLKSKKNLKKPIIIYNYIDIKKDFIKLILEIYNTTNKPIMILGRNNNDIYDVIDKTNFKLSNENLVYLNNPNIKMTYYTIHKSKGLEEENTIVINMNDSLTGFPNKIKETRVLRFVSKKPSTIAYDEERRLFYVALTRTKNSVYLYTKKGRNSLFIQELLKYHKKYLRKV